VQPLLQWKSNEYYTTRVCVALDIQHAMRMRHIVNCGLNCSTIFVHIITQTARFKKKITEHKMCFDFLHNFCLKIFSF